DIRINNGELKIKNIADNIRGGKRVDVIVETNNKLFNIELNACSRQGLDIRNSLYALQILVDQSYQVKDYNKIKKVIQINLNNFRCNKVKTIADYMMREKDTNDIIWEHLRIVNVDMELINKSCYNI
ncbi:MAG: PD-(D/E)XK nuclease family transposase, partial [Bacilli bacterium]